MKNNWYKVSFYTTDKNIRSKIKTDELIDDFKLSHKLKQDYDLCRKKNSLKEWKELANSARETFSKEELEKYGY